MSDEKTTPEVMTDRALDEARGGMQQSLQTMANVSKLATQPGREADRIIAVELDAGRKITGPAAGK